MTVTSTTTFKQVPRLIGARDVNVTLALDEQAEDKVIQKYRHAQTFHQTRTRKDTTQSDEMPFYESFSAVGDDAATSLSMLPKREFLEADEIDDLNRLFSQEKVPLVRLTRDILAPKRYDVRVRPVIEHTKSLKIHISMSLYQIIDVVSRRRFLFKR